MPDTAAGGNAQSHVPYDRAILVNVLVYHQRTGSSDCGCGWAKLGASHAEHIADVYEASVAERVPDGT